jgi:hypothetical protein
LPGVALFDRRKGYGEHSLDRRRSYVDIMERVLGTDLLPQPRQRNRFARQINLAGAAVGTAVASVEVRLLDSIEDRAFIVELKHVRS